MWNVHHPWYQRRKRCTMASPAALLHHMAHSLIIVRRGLAMYQKGLFLFISLIQR
jgi:hypothetical protein